MVDKKKQKGMCILTGSATINHKVILHSSKGRISKIQMDTMLENERAQNIYEHKIGATKTAMHKNFWQDQTGRWRTSVNYEITHDTFFALHGNAEN